MKGIFVSIKTTTRKGCVMVSAGGLKDEPLGNYLAGGHEVGDLSTVVVPFPS